MAGKIQKVSELAGRTARRITRDADGWKGYLDTASRLYRYSFDEQLLIYAQRPDATACATIETWNSKMRRWIRAGAKGIALIHKSGNGRKRLEYVFDMADTRPVRGAREPNLWEMREEYHAPVLAMLEKRYGGMDGKDLGDGLMEAAARAVDNICEDRLKDLEYDTEGSFLEGLDRENLALCFRETLLASVRYGLLARCGLDPMEYMDDYGLGGITQFSTPAVLHHLGDACSAATREVCMEIRREVRRAERAAWKNGRANGKKSLEKASAQAYSVIPHFIYFQIYYISVKFDKAPASNKMTFIPSDSLLPEPFMLSFSHVHRKKLSMEEGDPDKKDRSHHPKQSCLSFDSTRSNAPLCSRQSYDNSYL